MAKKVNKKSKKKTNKKKNKVNIPGIILIVSALFLGALIVVLVYVNRKEMTITGNENREIEGAYPMPSELVESDKAVYFPVMDIPGFIFDNMQNSSFTGDCPVTKEELKYVKLLYWGSDNEPHQGEMIVNRLIADKTVDIFFQLYKASYPIESIALVDEYGGNDEVSMANNNTSCFNSRKVKNSDSWSLHAYGLAIDINPLYNPYVDENGKVYPVTAEKYSDRKANFLMKITNTDFAYTVFKNNGFTWGGEWENVKDYQHFEYHEPTAEE